MTQLFSKVKSEINRHCAQWNKKKDNQPDTWPEQREHDFLIL